MKFVNITKSIIKNTLLLKYTKRQAVQSLNDTQQAFTEAQEKMQLGINSIQKVKNLHEMYNSILAITEQTNLLALDASIEAAWDRGAWQRFAVVADEIKNQGVSELNYMAEKTMNISNLSSTTIDLSKNVTDSSETMIRSVSAFTL